MNKIAFLFLTIDNLKHSSVWEEYFKGVDKKKYNYITFFWIFYSSINYLI